MSAKQRAEATKTSAPGGEVSVTWRKTTFRLPSADELPLEALEAEEAGRYLTALRLILGEEQYGRWRTLARTAADAEDFSAVVMREVGPGNP